MNYCIQIRNQQWIVFSLLISTHEIFEYERINSIEIQLLWFIPTQFNIDL